MRRLLLQIVVLSTFLTQAFAQETFKTDTLQTSLGNLKITFIGHSTLMLTFNGKIIYTDPISQVADYTRLPKADLILITHEHSDHLDPNAVKILRTDKTTAILTEACAEKLAGGTIMRNGDVQNIIGVTIEAVPAYNIVFKRKNGEPFHPKGRGNGYVISFGDKKVYIAGDTENIPEMKNLTGIHVAFLPMNVPYTMSPEMAADAARTLKPKIVYPYHYGKTDPTRLAELLKDEKNIEVRIRKM